MSALRSTRFGLVASTLIVTIALASGRAAGQATFSDNFDRADGPVDGWTLVSGAWQISDGAMTVTTVGTDPETVWIWAGDPPIVTDPTDMEIRAKVTFGEKPAGDVGRHGGFVFCSSEPTSRSSVTMSAYTVDWIDRTVDPFDYGFRLLRIDPGPVQVVLVGGTPDIPDVPLEWDIQVEGNVIRLIADGATIFEVTDSNYRGGHAGAWAYNNGTNMSVDDMEITYEATGLTACFTASTLAGTGPLEVEFDAACTQSVNGVASYDWDFGDGSTDAGSKVTHTFNFGGSYMITLTVTDTLDNVKTATATVHVEESTDSFSDDFNRPDGPVDGWVVHQGAWNIADGQLTTTSAGVENWAWAGDPAFSFPANFTLTFTLQFLVTPVDAVGRHGGVMFCATAPTWRYDANIDGYTIDWIDRVEDHGIRLLKITNGVQSVLDIGARDPALYPDPPVEWEIVVEGEIIRVFGDGLLYLEATDSTYRQGVFGIWCWSNNQTIAVDDVAVTSPQLSPCFAMTPAGAAEVETDVAFDASCSSATGTPISTYSWDFGDGSTGAGITATHAYSTAGLKTVKLTILTQGGLSSSTERTISIWVSKDSFEDDFDRPDGEVDGWTVVSPTWSLAGGALHVEAPGGAAEAWAFAGDPAVHFEGFTAIEFDVTFLNERPADVNAVGRHGGIFFFGQNPTGRYVDLNDGYTIDWIDRAVDHGYRLAALDDGVQRPVLLGSGGAGDADPGKRWRIEIDGDTIRLLVDGVLKIEATETVDPKYRRGFIGFWAFPGDAVTGFVQTIEFDNLVIGEGGPQPTVFHRGDANADGGINITDGIYVLNFLFLGGPAPPCREAANPNDDGAINITDGIYILNFLFLGGAAPASPGPISDPCGPDPAGVNGDLGCDSYTKC